MATHKLTAAYGFQYRFKCEHCGQTTEWLSAMLSEEKEYQSVPLEGKELRLAAGKEFLAEFVEKKVPALREKVEAGDYTIPVELDGKCPFCKKQQSWEKVSGTGSILFAIALCVILAFVGRGIFISGAEAGNGHRQLAGLIVGISFALGGLVSVIVLILAVVKKAAIQRDMEKTTVRNKPEFNWPEIEPVKE